MGQAVLHELINAHGLSEVLEISTVIVKDGAGGIKTLLEMLPADAPDNVLGFLDGDMEAEAKKWGCRGRLLFLPLTKTPEVGMLSALESDPITFAASANRPEGKVVRVLESTAGEEHDRLRKIGSALGFHEDTFTKLSFNHHLRVTGGQEKALEFARTLAKKARVSPPDLDL